LETDQLRPLEDFSGAGIRHLPIGASHPWSYSPQPTVGLIDGPLLERERELAEIDAALARARTGSGGIIVIEGAAGIGKSRLLRRAVEVADPELHVLTARGRELEREFGFGVVRQLFERPLQVASAELRARVFAGAGRLAAPLMAQGETAEMPAAASTFPLLHGLYWVLANLADEWPVLIAVDDAHWADAASLEFVAFLAPRLAELPVLVALTTRPRRHGDDPLAEIGASDVAEALRPRPLSEAAIGDLAGSGLGGSVDARFAAACHAVSGGNPFLLGELISDLAEEGVEPSAESASRVFALGPEGVGQVVLSDLARLSPGALRLARAIAVLEEGRMEDAAMLAGIPVDTATAIADELARAAILGSGLMLEFRHALVRNAIYQDIDTQTRAAMHRAAADLLFHHAAPEVAAAHLFRCAPAADQAAVRLLLGAARAALLRGSPQEAAKFLRRAEDEPPEEGLRGETLWMLAQAEAMAGEEGAAARFESAIPLLAGVDDRAEATRQLATIYAMQAGDAQQGRAVRTLEVGLEGLDHDEVEQRVALECDLVCFASIGSGRRREVLAHVDHLRALAEDDWAAGTPIGRRVLVRAAYDAVVAAEPAEVSRALVAKALVDERFVGDEPVESAHFPIAAFTLMCADDFDAAETLLAAGMADAQRRGSAVGFSQASAYRAMVALRRGALGDAEADARAGIQVATPAASAPLLLACLIDSLAEQGKVSEAEHELARHGLAVEVGETHFFLHLLEARGRLRLVAGRVHESLDDLREAVRVQELLGLENPALIPTRSSAARACLAAGEPTEASSLAQREVALARSFGAARALGVSLAVLGLTTGGEEGLGHLRESADVLEGSAAPLEYARSRFELGAALRRAGRRAEAREHLRTALEGAELCGAADLALRAREELLASGARPRRTMLSGVDALTPSELRVARMAAQGLSNPEIAQNLFVTRKTVEVHLSRCYRKLGIASRGDLPSALAKD
jgi:DNA-binding CsgD family transcriptional regulator